MRERSTLLRQRRQNARDEHAISAVRAIANQAFSRAAGAPLVPGNRVRVLKDASENYPAWLEAIRGATRTIHFENYIVRDDSEGWRFAEALAAKAREGVRVRVLYDWLGGVGKTSRRFWRTLGAAGVDVRCFNPPAAGSPFGWLSRDHRKMIGVDGEVAFVTGLCIGKEWAGDPACGREPWRDTGLEIRGPAVADVERAFAQSWSVAGDPLPPEECPVLRDEPLAGEVALRVVATTPQLARLYRVDLLLATLARERLWLTDAYFAGTAAYVQALCEAALDGVDVRLLVPGSSDIPVVRAWSQLGYRPLLEGGVRLFEWNGSMLHAKTAVADTRWARCGSTNLNLASWLGNWELDVVIEDGAVAGAMERMYLDDLARSTEVVLGTRRRAVSRRYGGRPRGSANRAAAGAMRLGNIVGAALADRRVLGPAEARVMGIGGALLVLLGVLAFVWPRMLAVPLAVVAAWAGVAMILDALRLRRRRARIRRAPAAPRRDSAAGATEPGPGSPATGNPRATASSASAPPGTDDRT